MEKIIFDMKMWVLGYFLYVVGGNVIYHSLYEKVLEILQRIKDVKETILSKKNN